MPNNKPYIHFLVPKGNPFRIWRFLYQAAICSILVMYPIFVSDGHSWKYIEKYKATIPLNYKIHGIDISKHNGVIDWAKIKETQQEDRLISFVVIKATEGVDHIDSQFENNWKNAKEHGFVRGAYHFFNPSTDPKLQALNFILNFKFKEGDLVPILDFENGSNRFISRTKLTENVKIWLEIVERHTGKKPIIYTNKPIYRDYIKGKLDDYPLWISDFYAAEIVGIDSPNLIMWQHTDKGKLEGINEYVDFNVFLGTPHKLQKYLL